MARKCMLKATSTLLVLEVVARGALDDFFQTYNSGHCFVFLLALGSGFLSYHLENQINIASWLVFTSSSLNDISKEQYCTV